MVWFTGGGAATVILESYESAVRRGAPILAEIIGWGFSGNGDHISTPNVAGPARSLELCLKDSGINPSEIGYVNAHATSTKIGDAREALAIAQIFGDYKVHRLHQLRAKRVMRCGWQAHQRLYTQCS